MPRDEANSIRGSVQVNLNNTGVYNLKEKQIPTWLSVAQLISIALINLGNYYIYSAPQAFQTPFEKKFGFSATQVQLLYSLYCFPNCVLPLVGGYLVSKIGDKQSLLQLSFFVFFGNFIFTQGIWLETYWVILGGRIFFGLGGESVIAAQLVCIEKWFGGKFLSAAMGTVFIVNYGAGMLNNFQTPYFNETLDSCFKTSVVNTCIVSFSQQAVYSYIILTNKYEHLLDQEKQGPREEDQVKITDIKYISLDLWLIFGLGGTLTCAYFSYSGFVTDFMQYKFVMSYSDAKYYASGLPAVVVVSIQLWSNQTEKIGKKGWMQCISGLIGICGYILTFFAPSDKDTGHYYALVPTIIVGFWFGMYQSAYWSGISILIEPKRLFAKEIKREKEAQAQLAIAPEGTKGEEESRKPNISGIGYGIANAGNNTMQSIYPIIFGQLNTHASAQTYSWSCLVLLGMATAGSIQATTVFIRDLKGTRYLDQAPKKLKELEEKEGLGDTADG